jgi:hypothetical protein
VLSFALDVAPIPVAEITRILAAQVGERVRRSLPGVRVRAAELLGEALRASPEYASLCDNSDPRALRSQLGLRDGKAAAEAVVGAVLASIGVAPLSPAGKVLGGVTVGFYRLRFTDAMNSPLASYAYSSADYGSVTIPWLEWLLFRGTERVTVAEIKFPGPGRTWRQHSRTGGSIMVDRSYDAASPSVRKGAARAAFGRYNAARGRAAGSGWSVPPQFAGDADDNWLLRAGKAAMPAVLAEMKKAVLG